MRRVWAVASLLLLGATWRLWIPQHAFPQVPLVSAAGDWPPLVGWTLLAAAVVCLLALTLPAADRRHAVRRTLLGLFVAALLGLLVIDQHRLQPWAYQSLIIAVLLAAATAGQVLAMLRLLAISVYAYSAAGKLDYQFLHTVGQQFLQEAAAPFGVAVQQWPAETRLIAASVFPLVEMIVAIGLAVPATRRTTGWAAVVLHATLIILLGPLGMQHQPGVLIWNGFFIAQAMVLFLDFGGRVADRRAAASEHPHAALVEKSSPGSGDGSRGADGVAAEGDAAAADRDGYPLLAWTVLSIALLMPLAERQGYWDHWLSWSLYSPHSSRVDLEIHASAVSRLSPAARAVLRPDDDGDGWRKLNLARWSIDAVAVPVYPQARFQLGVALAVADAAGLDRDVRARLRGPSDRWTGQRDAVLLTGRFRMREAADWFWLNADPR